MPLRLSASCEYPDCSRGKWRNHHSKNPTAAPKFFRNASKRSRSVAVVGGSAAGLFAASLLARRGVKVRVLEAAETLEPPARTLIVTPHMRSLLGASAERSVVNEIRRFEIFTDGRVATVPLKHPDLIIERRTLIQGLAEEARRAGASIETGKRFHGLHSAPERTGRRRRALSDGEPRGNLRRRGDRQ